MFLHRWKKSKDGVLQCKQTNVNKHSTTNPDSTSEKISTGMDTANIRYSPQKLHSTFPGF